MFAAKFRSKRGKYPLSSLIMIEIFTFLTVDVKAYIPPMQTVTVFFLKDLIAGTKKRKSTYGNSDTDIPMSGAMQIHVPAYESLSLKAIYAFFEQHPDVLAFLPDGKELLKVPKQWICNVAATVIGAPFVGWVGQRIKERNEAVVHERSMLIDMDPNIAAAFHQSTAVSRK